MKKRLTAQGKPFEFTPENLKKAADLIMRYPEGRQGSALVPLLDLAQRQTGGWLPQEAIEYVACYLGLSFMQGYEVASFYSMFNLSPVGKHFVQVCTTTPCQLRGAMDVLKACHDFMGGGFGVPQGQPSSDDGLFSVCEVECLGACVNGPVIQINDAYYEDLDSVKMTEILSALKMGKTIDSGSQIGRQGSAPEGGPQVLKFDSDSTPNPDSEFTESVTNSNFTESIANMDTDIDVDKGRIL